MDGILIINKEKGITSQKVLTKLKHILNVSKIGHCGTLDPIATGVLVCLLGSATKLSKYLLEENKCYNASLKLGIRTDTFDITGNITDTKDDFSVSDAQIDEVLNSFIGKSTQTPPIYSAIKINGKKLYEYARSGKDVEINKREIEIYDIKRNSPLINNEFSFGVFASKGTYIRSLIDDIGIKLNTYAVMTNLTRTKSGKFDIKDSYTLEDIEKGNFKLISMVDALDMPKEVLDENTYIKVKNGGKLSLKTFERIYDEVMLIYGDKLVAIYKKDQGFYKSEVIWN